MPKWLQAIINFFKSSQKPSVPVVDKPVETKPPVTQQPNQSNDKLKNPAWYALALKYLGKNEQDKAFDKFLSSFWKIVGLSGYKTIAGSKYAWCGLFVAVMLHLSGYVYMLNGAGAKNWDKMPNQIEYVKKGIPHGAIVRINHGFNCSSSSGNHVAFACGNYKPSDFFVNGKLKSGATITLLGGNQGNTVKYSKYDMKEICTVSWVKEELPPEVTKTIPCDTSGTSGESTQ